MKTEKTKQIEETVIPEIIAYQSVMRIRNIQLTKAEEIRKAKEKCARTGEKYIEEEEEKEGDPLDMNEDEIMAKRAQEDFMSVSENQKIKEAERQEIEKYGRFWIWEGYFNEKLKAKWLETAEALKHVNDHVLEDIEDYILLKGFGKQMKPEKIREKIEADHRQRIEHRKKQIEDSEAREKAEEKALEHIRKRKFMDAHRPHAGFWNLYEDGPDHEKVEHVLRHDANPEKCYIDGRVKKILENITEIGMSLRTYEEEKWN